MGTSDSGDFNPPFKLGWIVMELFLFVRSSVGFVQSDFTGFRRITELSNFLKNVLVNHYFMNKNNFIFFKIKLLIFYKKTVNYFYFTLIKKLNYLNI